MSVQCPRCNSEMREVQGRYGVFYGCSSYPNCKHIMNSREYHLVLKASQPQQPKKVFVPSKYQQAIFDFVSSGQGHGVVRAGPGSGKTTTGIEALALTPPGADVAFCAFGKDIAEEIGRRAPAHVTASTIHSLGFRALRESLPTAPNVSEGKVMGIIKEMGVEEDARVPLVKLVSMCKATLVDCEDRDQLAWLCDRYSIDTNGDEGYLFDFVPKVLSEDMNRLSVVDYDDMIWLPYVLKKPTMQFDWLFIDESQDLNAAQIELVMKFVKPTGRVVAIGDPRQAIYGFRGADTEAMDKMIARLQATILPLTISYRCPRLHVELAQKIAPELEAAPNAIDGVIEYASMHNLYRHVDDGHLVLCRVNAPLVEVAYSLIRRGTKAVIRGRDIGEGLLNLVDRLRARDTYHLIEKAHDYCERETAKLTKAEKHNQARSLQDKVDTLLALCDGIRDLSELRARISTIFDDKEKRGVILSSIHRAKGDEAESVWIMKPELLPHPMAKQDWELKAEENLQFVAHTRSKNELVFVDSD